MTKENAINAIIEYFEENEDVFNQAIEELDSYNGYLGDDRYYAMEELEEFYCDTPTVELLERAFFGYDEDSYETDERGERVHRQSFNPTRDYFRYNGYGNLVSSNYKDYSDHLDCYAVEEMAKNRGDIYTIKENEELEELFDALENAEEESEVE